MEASIETLWQEQLAKNPLLFNGSKFRLAGYSTEGDRSATPPSDTAVENMAAGTTTSSSAAAGAVSAPPPPPRSGRQSPSPPTRRLRLRLGLTDYRTFRGEDRTSVESKEGTEGGVFLFRCVQHGVFCVIKPR